MCIPLLRKKVIRSLLSIATTDRLDWRQTTHPDLELTMHVSQTIPILFGASEEYILKTCGGDAD